VVSAKQPRGKRAGKTPETRVTLLLKREGNAADPEIWFDDSENKKGGRKKKNAFGDRPSVGGTRTPHWRGGDRKNEDDKDPFLRDRGLLEIMEEIIRRDSEGSRRIFRTWECDGGETYREGKVKRFKK